MRSGRHFLQIPGPTNTPERILRAMHRSVIDHRGPEFAELGLGLLRDLKPVFQTGAALLSIPPLALARGRPPWSMSSTG